MASMNDTRIPNLSVTTAASSGESVPGIVTGATSVNTFAGQNNITGGLAATSTVTIGAAGTGVTAIISGTTAFDFASVSPTSFLEQSFVLTGATATSAVFVQVQDSTYSGTYRSLVFDARPSAANAVMVKCSNPSATTIDPASLTFRVTAINF